MLDIGSNISTHKIRFDLEIIASLIQPKSRILDIGCGDGELLQFLTKHKNVDGRGLELSQAKVSKAMQKGLSVIHGDAEIDLAIYPDNSFDYAILSQTIQATHNPPKILWEMLRISKYAIISLPNFAHFKNRLHLLFKGTMPVSKTIPFQWYETPNIHFCSIRDFEVLCQKMHFDIEKKAFLTTKFRLPSLLNCDLISNLFAEFGIFLLTKNELKFTGEEEFFSSYSADLSKLRHATEMMTPPS